MVLTTHLYAANISNLRELFIKSWHSNYCKSRCGYNIKMLVKMAHEKNIHLDQAQIVKIDGCGLMIKSKRPRGTSWNSANLGTFHVILRVEDKIFDYDFGNEPEVLSTNEYLKSMFKNPQENQNGLKANLKHFSFIIWDATSCVEDNFHDFAHFQTLQLKDFAPTYVE